MADAAPPPAAPAEPGSANATPPQAPGGAPPAPPGAGGAPSPPKTPPQAPAPPAAAPPTAPSPAKTPPQGVPPPPAAAAPPAAAPPPAPPAFAPQPAAPQAPPAAPKQYTAQTAGQTAGACAVATVKGAPSGSLKREYVTAVKAYEQQVGANIVRGKMFIESLPTSDPQVNRSVSPTGMMPGMMPGMAPGMVPPGMECGYNRAMSMGPGGPCGYGQQMPMGGGYGVSPLGIQRSREEFKGMVNTNTGVDFARLAEMGPEVRRLLDMGGQIDQIMDITRKAEGSPINMALSSDGGYGGPASGFGGPPPMMAGGGYDRPMPGGYGGPMMPPYSAPMPGMASAYSSERFPGGYGRPDMDPRMAGSAGYPRDGPRDYGRRVMSRENARSPRDDYAEESKLPAKHSLSRASDLLQKIKEDINEHCAESRAEAVLDKIRRDVVTMDVDDDVGRAAVRRNSLPPERGRTPSRTLRRPHDEHDYEERRSPRPRRRPSRHHKSSSSSSTSSSSHGKSHKKRSHKSKDSRGKHHKSKGKRRGSLPAKHGSSSSSSSSTSSSGRRSPRNKGGKSIEFIRHVTERFSSESPADEDPTAGLDEFRQKHMMIARPGSRGTMIEPGVRRSGCPVLNALGIGSREKGVVRTQSRTFAGSVYKYGTDKQPSPVVVGGALYRYESQPSGFKQQ
ncbi:hypothetical protein HPB50_017894 [Hyalomma asiaticum]|uniref:Uncharacterized protein n=1 Tax=Hyalomma asiaticum TaxID=266040 RepID=A0ACB7T371_HYAAI|nr:hypothetical protein HPB50_017894 [Hyalomma asiaticum]